MLHDAWKPWAICAMAQLGALSASAEALPLKKTLELGKPARPVEAELIAAADGLALRLGGASFTLPARNANNAELESVPVAEDAAVAIVRVSAENGQWVALLGGRNGKELLLAERSDLVGDPGERRATLVRVTPVPGSSRNEIEVGTRHEGLVRCGNKEPWLTEPRRVDGKTLKLVSASAPSTPAGSALEAKSSEGATPKLPLLSAVSSSEVDPLTRGVHVPHELVDGNSESTWSARAGNMALLRWGAPGLPITRIELQLSGRTPPLVLNLELENAAFHVQLPKASTNERLSIALPPNTTSSCLAIAPAGAGAELQLAEVRAFSDVDESQGVERLLGDLVQDGPRSALAADLLARLGPAAAESVAARFPEMSARGQRRALKILAPALSIPAARARVLESARSKDEDLSRAALDVLRSGKEPGLAGLRELVLEPGATGDLAARSLAARGVADADGLLAALAIKGGADRPALRRALVSVAKREPQKFRTASAQWLTTTPDLSARIGLAFAAALGDLDDLASTIAEQSLSASEFADRFRLCLTAAELGPSTLLDQWLAQQTQNAAEWMLRRTAYDALRVRGSPEAQKLAASVAQDTYPRVRAAAAQPLARAGQGAKLAELARNDRWPLVRAAATDALGAVPDSVPLLEELLKDPARQVRAAAVDALAAHKAASAWPAVEQRLLAENEWPVVQSAAVRFASSLCVQGAQKALAETARRALRPDANEDDRQLGLDAIRALHDLGGAAEADARTLATREGAPPELKRAFEGFGKPRCGAERTVPADR